MNTLVEFTAWSDKPREIIHKIFDEGFQQFHFVIEKYSRFDDRSELSLLNKKYNQIKKISNELFNLIEFSIKLNKSSDGAFDPTIIDFLETYGYTSKYEFEKLKHKKIIEKEIRKLSKNRPKVKEIKLNKKNLTIQLAKNQKIDLGAIGKGFAMDKAGEKLKKLKNFIINAGGDILSYGNSPENDGWTIELKPEKNLSIGKINLKNESVCCSGSSARKYKYFHHLINPSTGTPQNDTLACFVKSRNALTADSFATTCFVMGRKAEKFINNNNISALILLKNNKIILNNFPIL